MSPAPDDAALLLDAWCDLKFPDREIEVGFHPRGATPPGTEGGPIRILLVPGPAPRHRPA